jgi:polysaccharide pyruvyl transferase CsaB
VKVLISGYLGFGNIGDEAILAGLAGGLAARGHAVRALSAAPAATRIAHGLPASHRLIGLPWALADGDALVSGGGGLLQDATSHRSLRYYLGVIRAARATGLRVAVFAQSIGPLSARGRRAVARALEGVPVAVRDAGSEALLAELGIAAHRVADVALALRPPPVRQVGGVLLIPRADVAGARAGLEAVARDAVKEGRPVGVLALQPGGDAREADAIAAAVPGVERRYAARSEEALARCAEVERVVSVRLHGLVFALRAGRAHVGVAYDPKVGGFLDESGGVALPLPLDVERVRTAAREAAAPDVARVDRMVARAEHGLDWLDATLRGVPPPADEGATGGPRGDGDAGSMTP